MYAKTTTKNGMLLQKWFSSQLNLSFLIKNQHLNFPYISHPLDVTLFSYILPGNWKWIWPQCYSVPTCIAAPVPTMLFCNGFWGKSCISILYPPWRRGAGSGFRGESCTSILAGSGGDEAPWSAGGASPGLAGAADSPQLATMDTADSVTHGESESTP